MELHDNNEINDALPDPNKFRQQIATMSSQLPAILDDFKKYYVLFNKNPDYPDYQQMYQNVKSNLNNINSSLFMLSNDVQSNTDSMNKTLLKTDIKIKEERKKNKHLKSRLGIVEHKINASSELISDYIDIYDTGYLRNWGLFLSSIAVVVIISKMYKSPTAVVQPPPR
jgi:hypothetical protein